MFMFRVGSSRSSTTVRGLLCTILEALRHEFQLNVEFAGSEEDLIREFNRVLVLTSRRCNGIILIIDDIDKLTTSSGHSASLKWLPFSFPDRVRAILSMRSPSSKFDTTNPLGTTNLFLTQIPDTVQTSTEQSETTSSTPINSAVCTARLSGGIAMNQESWGVLLRGLNATMAQETDQLHRELYRRKVRFSFLHHLYLISQSCFTPKCLSFVLSSCLRVLFYSGQLCRCNRTV
jgi:hypothetical protein